MDVSAPPQHSGTPQSQHDTASTPPPKTASHVIDGLQPSVFLRAVLACYFVAPPSARNVVLVVGLSTHLAGAAIARRISPLHHQFSAADRRSDHPLPLIADQFDKRSATFAESISGVARFAIGSSRSS